MSFQRDINKDATMQGLNESPEDISNMARGHKANLSNPNTSDESKQHSKEFLDSVGGDNAFYGKQEEPKDPSRVAGGLKATINNPNDSQHQVSDEARESAQERLDRM